MTFIEYASLPDLSPDETYTIELLLERCGSKIEPNYFPESSKRDDARQQPDYVPTFCPSLLPFAATALEEMTWLSLQRYRGDSRPIRDITALRFLTNLEGLILTGNEVRDISGLSQCRNLRRLEIPDNPVQDLEPLSACQHLEILEMWRVPIQDFSVLQTLPTLSRLGLSGMHLSYLDPKAVWPSMEEIEIEGTFASFNCFPSMPKLRRINRPQVDSFDGLERFPTLENLVDCSGRISSLVPLECLQHLTHLSLTDCRINSLAPLAKLLSLRSIEISAESSVVDLASLNGLPSLHRVEVRSCGQDITGLEEFRASLRPWDSDFRAEQPRFTPSLELEVVSQSVFDHFDGKEQYGLTEKHPNRSMLLSELDWLDQQLEAVFSCDFIDGQDYTIPGNWGGGRSRTVVLYSEKTLAEFSSLVLAMQRVLCECKHDWILYFQSDVLEFDDPPPEAEFIIWIYPQKLVVAQEYAANVRQLIKNSI